MAFSFRSVLLVGVASVVWAVLGASSLRAQDVRGQGAQNSTVRAPGTTTNLFETLDPNRALDAFRVTLPEGWALEEARLLRYGTESVPVRVREAEGPGTHRLLLDTPIRGPHDLVVRVRTPDLPGSAEWSLQTLVREQPPADTATQPRYRTVDRRSHRVILEAPSPPDRGNRALSLTDATEPLRVRADVLPTLGQLSSFTIEFWVQTNGLDEVILSTWNGNESVAYPAEFVVDQGGRLRFYSGRPGQHQALQTGRPIADGQWHHVAAVYDARRSRLRLLLDGRPTDSLRGRGPPPAPGPVPIAVGGRLNRDQRPVAERQPLFSGQIDELRIWGEARSVAAVRRMKNRPFRGPTDPDGGRRLARLGFDTDGPDAKGDDTAAQWPEGARRVPTTLSFQSSLRNLRAETTDRAVTLRWAADAADVERFIVERSTGRGGYQAVAELTPEEAQPTAVTEGPAFRYTDTDVAGQVVFYRIRLRRKDGVERTSGTIKIGLGTAAEKPQPVTLIGNFPNPFSETTTVAFEVNESKPVTITVWDLQGHKIAQLADGPQDPGYHEVSFDATDLPSGNYFVRLKTPTEEQSHKMVVLK